MAVVTLNGSAYPQAGALTSIDAKVAEGEKTALVSYCDVVNGNSIASLLYFGRVPSNSLIYPTSRLFHQAITSVTDFDLGFYRPNGGTVIDLDALIDGADISSANAAGGLFLAGLTVLTMHMRAWQLAGLASDPGGVLDVVGTLKAAATASGRVLLALDFSDHS